MKYFLLSLFSIIIAGISVQTKACTTFLVSGKYTPDGRPLLYKHRDTGEPNNALVKFYDGKYEYIGLINATKNGKDEVWGGYNETGFAIINSAAYTNNIGDTTKLIDKEGVVMKKALQCCKTIQDFEKLLDTLPKPLGCDANFGVIDAYGGAAYYETGNFKYVKADANDPLQAPNGFMIRTNHSFSENMNEGYGYIRYQTTYKALTKAVNTQQLTPKFLLNNVSRNLTHSLTGENMESKMPISKNNPDFRFFIDYIPRTSSASTVLIVGTKKNGSPSQTMMWSLTGFQLTTVAVPVWLRKNIELPKIISIGTNGHAFICDKALSLKKKCFPIKRGSGRKYINFAVIENQQNTGYLQQIKASEKLIFEKASQLTGSDNVPKSEEIQHFYKWIDSYVTSFYEKI